MRRELWLPGSVLVGAFVFVGCSASVQPFNDEGGDGGSDGGATASQGGSGGSAEGGSDPGPCGQDCSMITAPPCHVAVCNTGQYPGPVYTCTIVPSEGGEACDDTQFCTTNDTCDGTGVCVGGPANDCGMTPATCESVVCDEATDSCDTTPIAAGEACTPADLCVVGATCDANGNCNGTPKDCFFAPVPNECHIAQCNPQNGMCEPIPGNFGQACTDQNDLCTINKACDMAGACVGGAPKNCSQLTMGCDIGICDTATGQCTTMTVMNGQTCDDLNGCTVNEICTNGTCAGGTMVTACSGGQNADGCCPTTCTAANDLDCAICAPGWDTGTLEGWTASSSCSPQINWQPSTQRAQAGTHSLYYGDINLLNFDCTGGAHTGTATSKVINLQPGTPDVTFWVWIETEPGTFYDQLGLWVMPANVQVWDRNDFPEGANGNTNGIFIQQTVDLSAYANQTIQLEFRFDTTDSIGNSGEGVYIDSLVVQGSCP